MKINLDNTKRVISCKVGDILYDKGTQTAYMITQRLDHSYGILILNTGRASIKNYRTIEQLIESNFSSWNEIIVIPSEEVEIRRIDR